MNLSKDFTFLLFTYWIWISYILLKYLCTFFIMYALMIKYDIGEILIDTIRILSTIKSDNVVEIELYPLLISNQMDISLNYRFLVKYWKWTTLRFLSCMSVVWLAGFWMIDFIKCWAWPIEQNSSRVGSYTYSIHVVDHDLPRLTTLAQPALEITKLWSVLR